MFSSLLLLASGLYTATAGLAVAVDDPPVLEARHADGGVRVRFPDTEQAFDSRGAAVVSLRPGTPAPERLRAEGTPIGAAARHWVVPAGPGRDALEVALDWAAHPDVAAAIPDLVLPKVRTAAPFDDPEVGGQWYLEELGMLDLFERGLGDPDVRIGVIDSATDVSHEDLAAGVVAPLDLVDGDDDPSPEACSGGYCDGHGTAVSGIIGARADNGTGIVGLCPACSVVPVRMLGSNLLSADVAAFEHLIEQDVAVINNSWGFVAAVPVPSALEEVIGRAASEPRGGLGAVVVFAAGNDNREIEPDEMQAMPRVVCVSAVDRYHRPTAFTNSGDAVDVAAPSATVSLAPNDGITTTFGGTSAAAPVVSGVVGWLLSIAPELEAAEIRDLLRETATQTSQVTFVDGHHPLYGYGEMDPTALLAAVEGGGTTATDTGAGGEEPGGCGCAVGGRGGPAAAWALAAIVAWTVRRRTT